MANEGGLTNEYAFFTSDHTMIRSFDMANSSRFIGPDGLVVVELRERGGTTPFVSTYDLVQVAQIDLVTLSCVSGLELIPDLPAPPGAVMGPDVSFDGQINQEDMEYFLDQFLSSSSPADYNADGVVDDSDAELFLIDYGSGN